MHYLRLPQLRKITTILIILLFLQPHVNPGQAPCLAILLDIHPRMRSSLLRMPRTPRCRIIMITHMVIIIEVEEVGTVTTWGEEEAEAGISTIGTSSRIQAGLGLGIGEAGMHRLGEGERAVGVEYLYFYARLYPKYPSITVLQLANNFLSHVSIIWPITVNQSRQLNSLLQAKQLGPRLNVLYKQC